MKASSAISGETFPWQIAAVFDDEAQASQAADALRSEAGLGQRQVRVYPPEDAAATGKLNPRSQSPGIARTLIRSHLTLGAAGAGVGFLVAMLVLWSGFPAFVASPLFSASLATFLGLIAGLLLGGLVALRPDQDVMRYRLKDAMDRDEGWAVVVRARDHDEERRVGERLQARGGRLISVL